MANYQERREKMSTAKKTLSVITAVAIFAIAALMTMCVTQVASAAEMNGNTATELVSFIGTGWNLGNTLDAIGGGNSPSSETSWGNPKTTKAMIDAVKAQGFSAVRVPVSWGNHTTGDNFTIDSKWLARVKEVVAYCIDNDMYVILNIHHDTSTQYYYPSSEYKERSVKFVNSIWTQVAKYFKDYDQKLIFETLNEPRLAGTGDEWWFDVNYPNNAVRDSISAINALNQTAVDAIRAAGGKNTDRCIMVPGYGASIDGCTTSTFKLPDDSTPNRLIVSVHAYTPYNFALNANGTAEFTNDLKKEYSAFTYLDVNTRPYTTTGMKCSSKTNVSANLQWNKNISANGYVLDKYDGSKWVTIKTFTSNANTSFNVTGLKASTTFKFRLRAYKTIGKVKEYSAFTYLNVNTRPYTTTGFKMKSATKNAITLQWNKNISASGYCIEKWNGSKWVQIKRYTSNANVTYTATGLKANTAYKFRIRAYKTIGNVNEYSAYSAIVTARTKK